MTPPAAARAMNSMELEKIVAHESVCAVGNRQARDAIRAAERQPVTINDQVSPEESAQRGEASWTRSPPRNGSPPVRCCGSVFNAEANRGRFIALCATDRLLSAEGIAFLNIVEDWCYVENYSLCRPIVFHRVGTCVPILKEEWQRWVRS